MFDGLKPVAPDGATTKVSLIEDKRVLVSPRAFYELTVMNSYAQDEVGCYLLAKRYGPHYLVTGTLIPKFECNGAMYQVLGGKHKDEVFRSLFKEGGLELLNSLNGYYHYHIGPPTPSAPDEKLLQTLVFGAGGRGDGNDDFYIRAIGSRNGPDQRATIEFTVMDRVHGIRIDNADVLVFDPEFVEIAPQIRAELDQKATYRNARMVTSSTPYVNSKPAYSLMAGWRGAEGSYRAGAKHQPEAVIPTHKAGRRRRRRKHRGDRRACHLCGQRANQHTRLCKACLLQADDVVASTEAQQNPVDGEGESHD